MKKAWIALLASMAGCACFARDDVRQVFLAASDSRPAAKATADYVCTGTKSAPIPPSASGLTPLETSVLDRVTPPTVVGVGENLKGCYNGLIYER